MEEKPFTPNMDKLKSELGRTPPAAPPSSPMDFAPKAKAKPNPPYQVADAEVSQQIKAAMRAASGWHLLDFGQQEALDLIATEIGRICAGRKFWKELREWADVGVEASDV
jgi:hypothetical protein